MKCILVSIFNGMRISRNWHAYDNVVLQDYLNLGGDPNISCGEVPLNGIQIENCPSNLYLDVSHQLSADFSPLYATNKDVTWSSSDTLVATVDDSGLVSAVDTGSAIITLIADDGGYSDQCTIAVKESPGCLLPWSDNGFTISGGTVNYHSGLIDISCASSVKISFDIETTSGSMESDQDYVFFSFKVDGGTFQKKLEKWGNVNLEKVQISDVSGSHLELFIEGFTSAGWESFCRVTNIAVEGEDNSHVLVTGVTLNDCPSSLLVGETRQLEATMRPGQCR